MYICALSNMLFRGDGKSSIHHMDSINGDGVQKLLDEFKATVGFINPPYSLEKKMRQILHQKK